VQYADEKEDDIEGREKERRGRGIRRSREG